MRLYHYTCHHARAKILREGLIKPNERSYGHLLWLTDLDKPDVLALGLTSFMLRCDRTAYRVGMETDIAVPWTQWAHDNKVPTVIRLVLDGNPGAQPLHWWVSTEEIRYLSVEPTWSKQLTRP